MRLPVFLLSALPCFVFAQNPAIDVLHYRFALELSDASDVIQGDAGIQLIWRNPVDALVLDLHAPEAEGKGMTVTAVTSNGQPWRFEQSGEQLRCFPAGLSKPGDTVALNIQYSGIPADGLIIATNRYGDRTFFGDNWPNRAHHWLPCVDHPSDKASVEFLVTAPEHYQVVANGDQLEETNLPGSLKRTHWRTQVVLPTKVMVIGAARFAVQLAGYDMQHRPVTSWVYPQDRDKGFDSYAPALPVLEYYERLIGPYPNEKLANVQSKTRYGGMENAGNIFYYEASVDGGRDIETLIAHEIVHQWFGNSASEADWPQVWLSEGFATYLTNLYVLDTQGDPAFRERLVEERETVLDFAKRRLRPIVDTEETNINRLLNANSYQKAGWVLHMLRQKTGDAAFRQGIRQYYQQYQFSNAFTDDFRKVMEKVSGQNLSGFFEQWLLRAGHPKLQLSWEASGKKRIRIQVLQIQEGPAFEFPLELDIQAGGQTLRQALQVTQKQQDFVLKIKGSVDAVQFDPEINLLWEKAK